MKVALDTNILAYAEGVNGPEKQRFVLDLLAPLSPAHTMLPVQTLGELFNVLTRKAGKAPRDARTRILEWRATFAIVDTSNEVMRAAADLAGAHNFGIWDAVILSAAAQAGCRALLSEDMQHGFTWGETTIVDPFAMPEHPLVGAMREQL